MVDFSEVVSWLNVFDKSHLEGSARVLVDRLNSSSLGNTNGEEISSDLQAVAGVARDPLCTAEVFIFLAEKDYLAGRYPAALSALQKAVEIYASQVEKARTHNALHRSGVAQWLAGCAGWGLQLHYPSYRYWWRARECFESAQTNARDEFNQDRVDWYEERILLWNIDLAFCAEEVYTWLYEFPSPHMLTRPQVVAAGQNQATGEVSIDASINHEFVLIQLRNNMVNEIKGIEYATAGIDFPQIGDHRTARQNVELMLAGLSLTCDHESIAEARLECGLALHQLRDNREAINQLRWSVSNFPPGGHQQAVAQWMLGIFQAQPGVSDWSAIVSLNRAKEAMQVLNDRAGAENNQERVNWYTRTQALMAGVISHLVELQSRLH